MHNKGRSSLFGSMRILFGIAGVAGASLAAFFLNAAAAAPPRDQDGGRPVEQVAEELGVTPEQFRKAFKKVRPAKPGERPTEGQRQRNRRVLSEALGVTPERLDEVMDKYRPGGKTDDGPPKQSGGRKKNGPGRDGPPPRNRDGGRPVEQIAEELGVTPEQFREAFKKVRPASPGRRPTEEQRQANRAALSQALGVSPDLLDQVMDKYRPGGADGGPPAGAGKKCPGNGAGKSDGKR